MNDLSIVFENKKVRNFFADDGVHYTSWRDVKFLLGLDEISKSISDWVPTEIMIKGLKLLNTADAHKMIAAIEGKL